MKGKSSASVLARIEERRALIFSHRKDGKTIREISESLGVSVSVVASDLKIVLGRLQREQLEDAELWRLMELERLDNLMNAVAEKALAGDLQAIDRVLKISQARRELLGLDVTAQHQMAVDFSKLSDDELQRLASKGGNK